MTSKRELRERIVALRRALGPEVRREASAAIVSLVCVSQEWSAARCVALFLSTDEEVDTTALIAAARNEGRRVALPVVIARGAPLEFRDGTDPAFPLARSAYGLWEPTIDAAGIPLDAIDLFVVPGVAFDSAGGRLGYGGGFYDRTLAGCAAPTLMVAFAVQEVAQVPMHPHDRRMGRVATEAGWRV